MKRGGRQHGMVRSCPILPPPLNPRPRTRFVNRRESPPIAGLFTKVPSKPTNHSKFTGKCALPRGNACHVTTSSKSRHKAKGALKLKSSDVVGNAHLSSRRVLSLSGLSVTRMLDHLAVDDSEDEGDEEVVGDYTASPKDSYSFADMFRRGDDDENGFARVIG
ncbi:hypothetical protein QN277_020748 [Acacia crassicarpa]|uniref:Uncharacterized protein n=1 Tax=Acacia crassicarpa TaxID=499986 RepID=A0AAE1JPZ9_9FABA|nr:hypothetical protein QN277_020748 [Acacia crassicarpa]